MHDFCEVRFYLQSACYKEAARACEQKLAIEPGETAYYAYLGLSLLLDGREEEAQVAWMAPIIESEAEEVSSWFVQLVEVLQAEANRQEQNKNLQNAWLLRQHLHEIDPKDTSNLIAVTSLSLQYSSFSNIRLLLIELIDVLRAEEELDAVNANSLLGLLREMLKGNRISEDIMTLVVTSAAAIKKYPQKLKDLVQFLLELSIELNRSRNVGSSFLLANLCAAIAPDRFHPLYHWSGILQDAGCFRESLPWLRRCLYLAEETEHKTMAVYLLLRGLLKLSGQNQEAISVYREYRILIRLLPQKSGSISLDSASRLIAMSGLPMYFGGKVKVDKMIRNRFSYYCQENIRAHLPEQAQTYKECNAAKRNVIRKDNRKLKIGYLSECFRVHSVGWLSRWLFHHHDREQFEIHLYSLRHSDDGLQKKLIEAEGDRFHQLPYLLKEITAQICQDDIDILVDLDSITSNGGCSVLAMKPAPIQITWLGYDSSGVPAVDYFLADPYVLPQNAQEYYSEKIWRLPKTYIAVDGFESGIPSLRRNLLDIPMDSILYYSSQTSFKRNKKNIQLQMQILREVPNSYFLIKDNIPLNIENVRAFFEEIACEENINLERLHFLPVAETSSIHRANLAIADVILDTFPYNGTTTTLEALWMEIPVVTRVGQQFASRQGYTLLKNAGIEVGVAWTDEEYVEWGIRLGRDEKLRQQVSWQLRLGKQRSPLWNAAAFTRDVEIAYRQVWFNWAS